MDQTSGSNVFSLDNLVVQGVDSGAEARMRQFDADLSEYESKYGANGILEYLADKGLLVDKGYDRLMKLANVAIYQGRAPCFTGTPEYVELMHAKWEARMRELYGDGFDDLRLHGPCDSRVGELLLADALRTGKWKELPDELQGEYHRRAGGSA